MDLTEVDLAIVDIHLARATEVRISLPFEAL
jgi:hypothetical protein